MNKKHKKSKKAKILITALFLSIVFLAVIFLLPQFSYAQEVTEGLEEVGEAAGVDTEAELPVVIGRIIRVFIAFMGIVLLGIIIYAGFLWMTAGGESEKVEKAKKWMTNGVIGLIIIIFAYSIVTYIINKLMESFSEQEVPAYYIGYGEGGSGYGGGALGDVLEDHYPPRNATNVPRNTFIMVKFYEPLNVESVMNNATDCGQNQKCGDLNWTNIRIFESQYASADGTPPIEEDVLITGGEVALTADRKIFFFKPADYLGSSAVDVEHIVYLTAGLKGDDNNNIFGGEDDYAWIFETGTFIDETPPKVSSVYPIPPENDPGLKFYANSIIQINFNEPVLPPPSVITSGASADAANSIYIPYTDNSGSGFVAGTFNVGLNQFRTIEFIPAAECEGAGPNSCGEIPKCLPKGAAVSPYIRSATVNDEGQTAFPFNGIVDAAGNSLDGNANDTAEGPPEDDYDWTFETSHTLDLTPPIIKSVFPENDTGEVPVDVQVLAEFSEGLSASYVHSNNVFLRGDEWKKWFVVHFLNTVEEEDENGQSYTSTNNEWIDISHGDFDKAPEVPEGEIEIPYKYYPIFTNRIRDLQQNCFYPCTSTSCEGTPCCCEGASVNDPTCGYGY